MNDITDAELLRLCRERLPHTCETSAMSALVLARQYTTKGVPECSEDGTVLFRPPNPSELQKLAQAIKWVELPEIKEKKVEDQTIIDAIEQAGMKLPSAVSCDLEGEERAL